jgi:hypothetical protein
MLVWYVAVFGGKSSKHVVDCRSSSSHRSSVKNRMFLASCRFRSSLTSHVPSSFFHGHDNYDQLVKIAKVLGTDELFA